jgi:hypothetical protein
LSREKNQEAVIVMNGLELVSSEGPNLGPPRDMMISKKGNEGKK